MRIGKLIVIDGLDGSGKGTQAKMLFERLKKDGKKVKIISFPNYEKSFFGKFIGHCLSKQYYNFVKLHPKIASVLYAADRWESKNKIDALLKAGYIVIADRYASSNQIHQGGKISNAKKRSEFIKWLNSMEYDTFKMQKPNIIFYLKVPVKIILRLLKNRNANSKKDNLSSIRKKDAHEKDIKHLENAYRSAVWLSKNQDNWITIDCLAPDGKNIDTFGNIHEKIYNVVIKNI